MSQCAVSQLSQSGSFFVRPTGRLVVIDLNARATASYVLGCLRGHFYERRRSTDALVQTIAGCRSLGEFQGHFEQELCDGKLIVSAWAPHIAGGLSLSTIVMAAQGMKLTASPS